MYCLKTGTSYTINSMSDHSNGVLLISSRNESMFISEWKGPGTHWALRQYLLNEAPLAICRRLSTDSGSE